MTLLLLLIYAQLDGKMERNLDVWTKQYICIYDESYNIS